MCHIRLSMGFVHNDVPTVQAAAVLRVPAGVPAQSSYEGFRLARVLTCCFCLGSVAAAAPSAPARLPQVSSRV